MNNLSEIQVSQIQEFFNENALTHLNINDYISGYDLNNLDFNNAFEDILDILDSNEAFYIEIIYYKDAMEYLSKYDYSLHHSLSIAAEYGYKLEDLSSEILASLIASEITRGAFAGLKQWIEEFFENFLTTQNV